MNPDQAHVMCPSCRATIAVKQYIGGEARHYSQCDCREWLSWHPGEPTRWEAGPPVAEVRESWPKRVGESVARALRLLALLSATPQPRKALAKDMETTVQGVRKSAEACRRAGIEVVETDAGLSLSQEARAKVTRLFG